MKLKKLKIYLLSMVIPVIIFLACATIIGFLPFNEELLNSYDSFTQYPGFLLEFIRLLKKGNIFYSFNGALGFNFFSTMTYYTMSPLNLLAIFATPQNYPYFIAVMTLIRFSLMSLSMCFYLDNKKIKPLNIIILNQKNKKQEINEISCHTLAII